MISVLPQFSQLVRLSFELNHFVLQRFWVSAEAFKHENCLKNMLHLGHAKGDNYGIYQLRMVSVLPQFSQVVMLSFELNHIALQRVWVSAETFKHENCLKNMLKTRFY